VLPTAQQSVLVVHDTPARPEIPLGTACDCHVLPPLLVTTTAPAPAGVPPTAQQSVLVLHDTLAR
jgi:hypothetical protein